MLKTFALSLVAAIVLTLGAGMQSAPAKAGVAAKAHNDGRYWRKHERRHWRKAHRHHRKAPYPYKRYIYKVHYPSGCYYGQRVYTVRSLGPYGWYRKSVWRPVHICR